MSDDDYGDLFMRNHTHSRGLPTEKAAAAKATFGASSMKRLIMEELSGTNGEGITPDEFAEKHQKLINTVRRRFTDLWKDGFIRHHPESLTRRNSDDNECVVWIIGRDEQEDGTTETKILKLRDQLRSNGINPCC